MGSFKHCLQAVMLIFMVANTLAMAARAWVRLALMKLYGWDDVVLVLAYLGFIIGCTFGFIAIHFGFAADGDDNNTYFDNEKMVQFYAMNQYALYISSGLIKMAVALVLYRLADGLKAQVILVIAIIVMVLWTFITTIFAMGLCASTGSASYTGPAACAGIGYFRMISNIFIDYFFALFPIPMLWSATLSRRMKIIVCCLLGLGMIASAATVAKLILLVELESVVGETKTAWIHIQLLIWSDVELGLAIFTAILSGLRPLVRLVLGARSAPANATLRPTHARGSAYPRAMANAGDTTVQTREQNKNDSSSGRNDGDMTSDDIEMHSMNSRPDLGNHVLNNSAVDLETGDQHHEQNGNDGMHSQEHYETLRTLEERETVLDMPRPPPRLPLAPFSETRRADFRGSGVFMGHTLRHSTATRRAADTSSSSSSSF